LQGGLTPNRMYRVEGVPGSGKTTLSLQFLLEGARRGEPVLYVSLSESAEEIRAVAARDAAASVRDVRDGFEVARRVRRQPAFQGVLLIALTGFETVLRGSECGLGSSQPSTGPTVHQPQIATD
jgi:predicted ATP-dependent serine protease